MGKLMVVLSRIYSTPTSLLFLNGNLCIIRVLGFFFLISSKLSYRVLNVYWRSFQEKMIINDNGWCIVINLTGSKEVIINVKLAYPHINGAHTQYAKRSVHQCALDNPHWLAIQWSSYQYVKTSRTLLMIISISEIPIAMNRGHVFFFFF